MCIRDSASAIKQAIVNLLLTNKGERPFNPDYGSDIREYLFEPLDYATSIALKTKIAGVIEKFEPRIGILELSVYPNEDDNGFDIDLVYEIRGSDEPPTAVEFFLARTR